MSARTQIEGLTEDISAAYNAVAEMGGQVPDVRGSALLPGAIRSIPRGMDTSDATAAAGDILKGKTAYVKNQKVEGTIVSRSASNLAASGATVTVPAGYYPSQVSRSVASATQATPSISVSSGGQITASATQAAGYVAAGTKASSYQLPTQGARTITPGAADQAIAAGYYLTGAQTVKGDANLLPANIKEGVSIFGVVGTVQEGIDTSDATVAEGDILSGKTAYANGQKLTGTLTVAGKDWTEAKLPSIATWQSVAYGGGKFVTVAAGGKVAYSMDGITWTAATMPSSEAWQSVAYGGGKFVAIAASSDKAAYSTDGVTWTAATLPSSGYWYSVAYGGGKFVAVAYNSNKAAYSQYSI